MAIPGGGQRPFPAVVVVSILFLVCLFPGQLWIAPLLPGISGLAKIDLSLTIFDIPVPSPVAIDLILVPGLFILIYTVVILVCRSRPGIFLKEELVQRLWAVFSGFFILLICVAFGGLITYLVLDHLPREVRNGVGSMGINADVYLPYPGYESIHLRGNVISLICFMIGMVLCIGKIKRVPGRRKTEQLTREQRMTPYQRMILEKRKQEKEKKEITRQLRSNSS